MSFLSFIIGCSGIDGKKYEQLTPAFDLKDYFNGKINAWGIIQDRSGNVIKRFDVKMDGSWEGNEGTLDEVFNYYDDPEPQYRVWKITKIDDLNYTGTAGDIIGQATGKMFGNAINWHYEMDVPVDNSSYRLKFDDWMWAMEGGVVVNRSYLKKFGITFAEITIFMQKEDNANNTK